MNIPCIVTQQLNQHLTREAEDAAFAEFLNAGPVWENLDRHQQLTFGEMAMSIAQRLMYDEVEMGKQMKKLLRNYGRLAEKSAKEE